MSEKDVFADTGGLFALLVKNDAHHGRAAKFVQGLRKTRSRLVVTDYVLDETATLLKVRRVGSQVAKLFELVDTSERIVVEWVGSERFTSARAMFLRHADHGYSFTDCTSFVIMNELHLTRALAVDRHFREAGFVPVLG